MRGLSRFLPAVLLSAAPLGAATYVVTTNSDAGPGSLRAAITNANVHPGADFIVFAIPGAGVHTIRLKSELPPLDDTVTIDEHAAGGRPNADRRRRRGALTSLRRKRSGGTRSLVMAQRLRGARLAFNRFRGFQRLRGGWRSRASDWVSSSPETSSEPTRRERSRSETPRGSGSSARRRV
jgi:hypothetical protein